MAKPVKDIPSITTPNILLTKAQYITELLCANFALKFQQRIFPYFWKDESWKPIYSREIKGAWILINTFPKHFDLVVKWIQEKKIHSISYGVAKFSIQQMIKQKEKNQISNNLEKVEQPKTPTTILDVDKGKSRTLYSILNKERN